jgi:hypothetical protein
MSTNTSTTCPTCGFPNGYIGSVVIDYEDGPRDVAFFPSPCACNPRRRFLPEDPAFLALKDFIRKCGEDPDQHTDDHIFNAFQWSVSGRSTKTPADMAACIEVCGKAYIIATFDFPDELKRLLFTP